MLKGFLANHTHAIAGFEVPLATTAHAGNQTQAGLGTPSLKRKSPDIIVLTASSSTFSLHNNTLRIERI